MYLEQRVGAAPTTSSFSTFNTLRPRQNGRHFADDTFKRIFLNENVRISITISLKFVSGGPINNIPALVQIMAWCRPGDKPLSEPMMVSSLTHICVTRPQWVNTWFQWIGQRHLQDETRKKPWSKPVRSYLGWQQVIFLPIFFTMYLKS